MGPLAFGMCWKSVVTITIGRKIPNIAAVSNPSKLLEL